MNYLQKEAVLSLSYTENELEHLQDVKTVMKITNYVFLISWLLVSCTILYYWKDKKKIIMLFKTGSFITLTSAAVILLLTLTSFNGLFTGFHYLFFPQGNWLFPADSLLIRTFPLDFFTKMSISIFVLIVFLSGAIYLITRKLK